MKILYFNVIELNSPWGAECFINRGFQQNGAETICIDYRKNRYDLVARLKAIEDDFDVLFLQRGDNFPLEILKAVNRPKFFWASELVSRCHDHDHLLQSGIFQHVFVHSTACKKTLIQRGWLREEQVTVLLNGFDPEVQHPMKNFEKDIDVLFVGNKIPRRERVLDQLETELTITRTKAYGMEMTELFNRAKVVLNLHSEDFLDTETRIFEALGCGAFVVTEPLSEESPFISGTHLVEVNSGTEMIKAIDHYLEKNSERNAIAEEGIKFIQNHSYAHRAKQLMDFFQAVIEPSKDSPIDLKRLAAYSPRESRRRFIHNCKQWLKSLLKR